MTELDPDGRRLFLQLSADLYEQAIQHMQGGEPRNPGLAFWQAIREAMDAEAEEHKRRMTVYRMLEDLAVFRMAKVQGMPYDRIGARAGKRSRTWAFQHTMPQDVVDELIRMYAEAEAAERDAFVTAQAERAGQQQAIERGEGAEPAQGERGSVIPIGPRNANRPAPHESARRSLLYRQLRRFLGGAATVAGPAYVAVKSAAESYAATVQTALMSNGALTPMPGIDPLSAGSLSSALSASSTGAGAAAQASGPMATAVGKVVASAVIGVQATAGVSAPAAVAITAAAGTPVVLVAEEAAKPIVEALGLRPGPTPTVLPDALAALPALMPTATAGPEEPDVVPVDTTYHVDTPTSSSTPSPTPEETTTAAHHPAVLTGRQATAAPPPATPVPTKTSTPPTTLPARTANSSPTTATKAPEIVPVVVEPTATASATPSFEPPPSPTSAAPTAEPTPTPVVPASDPTPTGGPTTLDPTPPPSSVPKPTTPGLPPRDPQPAPDEPTPTPAGPTQDPRPTAVPGFETFVPLPTNSEPTPPEAPTVGGPAAESLLPEGRTILSQGLRPASSWWY